MPRSALSLRTAQLTASAHDMTIRKTEFGEYRLAPTLFRLQEMNPALSRIQLIDWQEVLAYYTSDLQDAFDTIGPEAAILDKWKAAEAI